MRQDQYRLRTWYTTLMIALVIRNNIVFMITELKILMRGNKIFGADANLAFRGEGIPFISSLLVEFTSNI